jgi:hypothetical protein
LTESSVENKPVYLHEKLAKQAVELVTPSVERLLETFGERPFAHIVVLDPNGTSIYDRKLGEAPEGAAFEALVADIARRKAKIHFRTGRPSPVVRERAPHLLRVGDTTHGGSFDHEGLIAAVSGVQAHLDETIAAMVASMCWGLCKEAQARYLANPANEHFYEESVEWPAVLLDSSHE